MTRELPRFTAFRGDQPDLVRRGFAGFVTGFRVFFVLIFIGVGLVAFLFLVFLGGRVAFLFFVRRLDRALFALGGEGNPFAVGRPMESLDGFFAPRQLKTRAR